MGLVIVVGEGELLKMYEQLSSEVIYNSLTYSGCKYYLVFHDDCTGYTYKKCCQSIDDDKLHSLIRSIYLVIHCRRYNIHDIFHKKRNKHGYGA